MSALEQLAQAVLDGRVRITVETTSVSAFGIPMTADFQLEVDPAPEDDQEEEEAA